MRRFLAAIALLVMSGCATIRTADRAAPVSIKIIAFNDFHGALEPPHGAIIAPAQDGATVRVPAGGAAYFASAVRSLRAANPNNILVAAGDLISASPLISAQFLDEPTILAMNRIGLDLSAVGNHEFDRGPDELLRMQNGGCAWHSNRRPCAVDRNFPGARFQYLAANITRRDGQMLLPAYAIRRFGRGARAVRIGFIGLTLRQTATLVSPAGVAGLTFGDEAQAINALVPRLRAEGAEAIVVLIHQGLSTTVGYNDHSCAGVDGDLLPILARLDPSIDLIVSGHTHNSYICDYGRIDASRPFLVTSAGKNGMLLTDITLSIDPIAGRVVARSADNVIVQSEAYSGVSGPVPVSGLYPSFPRDPAISSLVARYAAAAAPVAARVVGHLAGPAPVAATPAGESVLGDLIADAQLAATSAPATGNARIALTNGTGVRADIVPEAGGNVTFGQVFAAQPFGNDLVVKTMTGRQIRRVLEQQFESGTNSVAHPVYLQVSRGFTYSYDLSRPPGSRIIDPTLDGVPLDDTVTYRVAMNSFLASGGDNFTAFLEGIEPSSGPLDADALANYFAGANAVSPPLPNRVTRLTPP
jgi:5'-nucleotidase